MMHPSTASSVSRDPTSSMFSIFSTGWRPLLLRSSNKEHIVRPYAAGNRQDDYYLEGAMAHAVVVDGSSSMVTFLASWFGPDVRVLLRQG